MAKNQFFKLVFNTDGEFVSVEAPNGKPAKMNLTLQQMKEKRFINNHKEEASYLDLMLTNRIEYKVKLVDAPGHSICCGECGGKSFCWC